MTGIALLTLVTLATQVGPVTLSRDAQAQIARRVETLMVGCAINSVTEPKLFDVDALPQEWENARAGAHLYLRFAKPITTRRSEVMMSEVVIGLQEATFIGPELSRHDGRIVGHVKCDGHRALALMCATPLRPLLVPGQAKSCEAYDRIGEPRD